LPQGWEPNMSSGDRAWVGHTLFVGLGKLAPSLKNWWYLPPPDHLASTPPSLCLLPSPEALSWMPRTMWRLDLCCPHCEGRQSLRSKGLYNHVHLVIDVRDKYYFAGKYMDCVMFHGTFISWDHRVLQ